ncbi:MAG: homoserine O-acetyltransferase [Fimbriimonadaceae bacterium]
MAEGIDPGLFDENQRTAPVADERRFVDVGAMDLEAGGRLEGVTVAYETWGTLSPERDNAILICHAISGDAHAIGWWDRIIGPGKAIDTDRFFVIGQNALGGCQGTTGPSSMAPDGRPYGSRFPILTMRDIVEAQRRLVDYLQIERLHAVAGGSMGGVNAIAWTVQQPSRVRKAWITASGPQRNAMQIGFSETARQAIMRDPKWRGGDYPPDDPPFHGLTVARMIGHLSYLSEHAFDAKFGRRLQDKARFDYTFDVEFQVESYLRHQGEKFTRRFDANSFLTLSRAIDYFTCESLEASQAEYLVTAFTSDWLYPPHVCRRVHELALQAGRPSRFVEVDLPYGHDAFLLDGELQGAAVRAFLHDEA